MAGELRKSGLPLLGELPWGSHLHVFYETKDDLLNILSAYFAAGWGAKEYCIAISPDWLSREEIVAQLVRTVPDFEKHVPGFSIIPIQDWVQRYGAAPKQITDGWQSELANATAQGFVGLRAGGGSFWLDRTDRSSYANHAWEVDSVLAEHPILVLSTYPLETSRAADFLEVVSAHRVTLACRNGEWSMLQRPYAMPPGENATRLEHAASMLARLTRREREVTDRLVEGQTYKEIGAALGISDRTVEVYRNRILQKTGAQTIAALIRLAILADTRRGPAG